MSFFKDGMALRHLACDPAPSMYACYAVNKVAEALE
jgi:hypothetical protein